MFAIFAIGAMVCVAANTASFYPPDRNEATWRGRIIYETERDYGVQPLDGHLPRDVLKWRVVSCEALTS